MLLRTLTPPVLAAFMIGGCATPASYPSLLPRPAESQSLEEPNVAQPQPSTPEPALDAKISELIRTLDERSTAFSAADSRAERKVAAATGAAAGSEAWLDAHVALAELDTLRSATSDLAITIDDMAAERAMALAPTYAPLTSAADRVRAVASDQAERITALQSRLTPF